MFSEKGESQAKQLMEREYARMQDQVERLKAEVDTASLKIDELRSDRAWSEQARGECLLEIDRLKRHLGNLLARIHRDGGHHTEAVGLEQSVADAYEIVARLHVTRGNEP